jgi:hypothetical protein
MWPFTPTGEAAPETVVNLEHSSLQVEVEAINIPEGIEISTSRASRRAPRCSLGPLRCRLAPPW